MATIVERLNDKFNDVMESEILSYSFDILRNKLTMEVRRKEGETVKDHVLEFLRVATVYYLNGSTESRRRFSIVEEGDWLELSDAAVLDRPVMIDVHSAPDNDWDKHSSGGANIVLEIWAEDILLEAAEVRIDGESFVIGDW